jgi:hypothetical protein
VGERGGEEGEQAGNKGETTFAARVVENKSWITYIGGRTPLRAMIISIV